MEKYKELIKFNWGKLFSDIHINYL